MRNIEFGSVSFLLFIYLSIRFDFFFLFDFICVVFCCVSEALEILNKKSEVESKENAEDLNFLKSSICWRMLNFFAEKGDLDRVNEFFNLFIDRELVEVNNILLGPLIKVHVTR